MTSPRRGLSWLYAVTAAPLALAALLAIGTRTTAPPLPDGVSKRTVTVRLTGRAMRVDLYAGPDAHDAPVAIVAHGFSRGRRHMVGWGGLLAANGFVVAIPDQPSLSDVGRNSRALIELLQMLRSDRSMLPAAPGPRCVMIGFSLGGLTSLLAAAQCQADAWIGLDPVDFDNAGRRAAKKIRSPVAVIVAESGLWNRHANIMGTLRSFTGPVFSLRVKGAGHCDVESPTDLVGKLACGPIDPARLAIFQRYAVAFLMATLQGDAAAGEKLKGAAADPAVAAAAWVR